jgi:ATP-dependent DNA ligase
MPMYTPMAPTLVREPFPATAGCTRRRSRCTKRRSTAGAYKAGDRVRLVSRDGRDHARRFDELAAAIGKLSARSLALDGEVAIFDQRLRSRFDWLREPDPAAVATPPLFMAFDVLYQDRRDLTARPSA